MEDPVDKYIYYILGFERFKLIVLIDSIILYTK